MSGVLAFRALRFGRVDLELRQHLAGDDHIARIAGQLQHLAGHRRRHFDHGLGGFHRHQRCIQQDGVAGFHEPLDDGGVGQAFAEVGEKEGLGLAHACAPEMMGVLVKWLWSSGG